MGYALGREFDIISMDKPKAGTLRQISASSVLALENMLSDLSGNEKGWRQS
jgi:hypothetical protein